MAKIKLTDRQIADMANSLYALTKSDGFREDREEACWDFLIEHMDTILKMAFKQSRGIA